MKVKTKIISIEGPFALVELDCVSGCQDCAARGLCSNRRRSKGIFRVLNPVKAGPGDEVMVDVPEGRYNKSLIIMFGLMLLASVAGMFLGFYAAGYMSLNRSTGGILGFFLGLAVTTVLIFHRFKKNSLYPEITGIVEEGDDHE